MNGNCLIVGGTSGLGLELGKIFSDKYETYITGRKNPQIDNLKCLNLVLDDENVLDNIENLISGIGEINHFIYSAGFAQDGRIDEFSYEEIVKMNFVGLIAPGIFLNRILKKQGSLDGFIAITSTSQYMPREREPIYCSTKAGLGMLANSISLDPRVKKTMLAAPAGMNTNFWRGFTKDISGYLDPKWVAEQIVENYEGEFKFKSIKILREPNRTILDLERF